MPKVGAAFSMTSFLPVPLLLAGAVFGGAWSWIALIYLTLFAFILDELIALVDEGDSEFPAADKLAIILAIAHFVVLIAVVWRFGQGISFAQGIALFLATGLFAGQIGNANAHELIHKGSRAMHLLGMWVYISLLFGHHTSAHRLVHHRFVATHDDPNTARYGESYYRFAPRAWVGSFRKALTIESKRHGEKPARKHPFAKYTLGALGCAFAALLIGGWFGLLAFLFLVLFAQSQLLVSDYVQHYGLKRRKVDDGLEPVSEAHSWNAPHLFTSHMILNAPRHSAHHTQPSLQFNELPMPDGQVAPMLPYSLPAMSIIALVPPLWRRVMDPRLAYWQTEEVHLQAA